MIGEKPLNPSPLSTSFLEFSGPAAGLQREEEVGASGLGHMTAFGVATGKA